MTGDCETEARNKAYDRYAFTESIKWKFFVNEWLTPSNKPCNKITNFSNPFLTLSFTGMEKTKDERILINR